MAVTRLPTAKASWKTRYGEQHRLTRVSGKAIGVELPKRVRIYQRRDHYILQWWEPSESRNLNQRVDGDLIAAISVGRVVEERLENFRSAGAIGKRTGLMQVFDLYLADLQQRADAGQVATGTVRRYRSAIEHCKNFATQPRLQKNYPYAHQVDRQFQLKLACYLQQPDSKLGARSSSQYVVDTCRAVFAWAADPARGNLLPQGFINPFVQQSDSATQVRNALIGEPDISIPMAADLIAACDDFQLPVFATILLYGLRPSELSFLFHELIDDQWFRVECLPELYYFTKGRRNKMFPRCQPINALLDSMGRTGPGLLFNNRLASAQPRRTTLPQTVLEYRRRCQQARLSTATVREQLRNQVLAENGWLDYDRIEGEFRILADRLAWPRNATLKDLRHLFSTSMENAGVPEFYRKFFMGQSPGRAPIVGYTHLNRLEEQYMKLLETEFAPIVAAINERLSSGHR